MKYWFMAAIFLASFAAAEFSYADEERWALINAPDQLVVMLRNAEGIVRDHGEFRALIQLLDEEGKPIDAWWIDFAHPATRGRIIFRKNPAEQYSSVYISPRDEAFPDVTLPLPQPIEPRADTPLSEEISDIGRGVMLRSGEAPSIRLPDFEAFRDAELTPAEREIDIDDTRRRVRAEYNFPIAGSRTALSRSTFGPDRHSFYVPMNSDLYDPETGEYQSTFKYLCEIPIDEEWISTADDTEVAVSPEELRMHMTTETIDVPLLGEQRLTGERKGLLGQTINSTAIDEDGNLYFALGYSGPVRFNVNKGKWEAPPVQLYRFFDDHKPALEDIEYREEHDIVTVRPDFSNLIYHHNGRIWVLTGRYMITQAGTGRSLFLAGVMSMPVDNWDDEEEFRKGLRYNAGATPNEEFPLWDTLVQPNDEQRKLNLLGAVGNRICLMSYHYNYFWVMEVDDDGDTTSLTRIDSFDGKRITGFGRNLNWIQRGDEILGLEMAVILEGEDEGRPVFLPIENGALTARMPEGARKRPFHFNQPNFLHNSAGIYGKIYMNKYNVASRVDRPHIGGLLTVYYDAIGRMRQAPGEFAQVIEQMNAASMGPEYYMVATPGDSMETLGAADYPNYNLARYDCSADENEALKSFLISTEGGDMARLSVLAGMGPYTHSWFREGEHEVLHFAGYTGVAKLKYSIDGEPLERHKVEKLFHGDDRQQTLDGSPNSYIKWYRDMLPGMGDKVFLTGVNQTQRGGDAYSNGLLYYHRETPHRIYKLGWMSRSYNTTAITGRLRGEPGGGMSQDIFLMGNFSESDALTLPENQRPVVTQPRVFLYRDSAPGGLRDLFSFTVVPQGEQASINDIAVSANGLYLALRVNGDRLLTYDIEGGRFADGIKLPSNAVSFWHNRRGDSLLRLPDGGLMICLPEIPAEEGAEISAAVFHQLNIAEDGAISLSPVMRCVFDGGLEGLTGTMCFVYDSLRDDGTYDLVLGPNSRKPEGSIRIVRAFLMPADKQ